MQFWFHYSLIGVAFSTFLTTHISLIYILDPSYYSSNFYDRKLIVNLLPLINCIIGSWDTTISPYLIPIGGIVIIASLFLLLLNSFIWKMVFPLTSGCKDQLFMGFLGRMVLYEPIIMLFNMRKCQFHCKLKMLNCWQKKYRIISGFSKTSEGDES